MLMDNKYFVTPFLITLLLIATACEKGPEGDDGQVSASPSTVLENTKPLEQPAAGQVMVTILDFIEVEQGTDPYSTRMLISDRYLRVDEGDGTEGYVLFDRKKQRIFSVVNDNESIVVVDPANPLQPVPDDLKIRTDKIVLDDMPTISGVQPSYYQFYANDILCYHLVAADGLLPKVTSILKEYQSVLAAQQQESLGFTPTELLTPCYLANYIYAPTLYIMKGFPIEQWDIAGYRRSLQEIRENVAVNETLFSLPDEYQYFSIGGGNRDL